MRRVLSDPQEMQVIYEISKDVFEGKYAIAYALKLLEGKVKGTKSSLKMYFNIYACMRKGKCYKMGTSEYFTKFLLNSIYRDFGKEDYIKALTAVKGNYAYRASVNNTQSSLIRACIESIAECGVDLLFEDIPTARITTNGESTISEPKKEKMPKIKGVHAMSENSDYKDAIEKKHPTTHTEARTALSTLIDHMQAIFDLEPFERRPLIDLIESSGDIPVILMNDIDGSGRKRSFYPNNKIYALQQGADNKDKDKAVFLGDSHVVIDTNKINIQIHKIIPQKRDAAGNVNVLVDYTQYMFAIYVPKEKKYYVKG